MRSRRSAYCLLLALLLAGCAASSPLPALDRITEVRITVAKPPCKATLTDRAQIADEEVLRDREVGRDVGLLVNHPDAGFVRLRRAVELPPLPVDRVKQLPSAHASASVALAVTHEKQRIDVVAHMRS